MKNTGKTGAGSEPGKYGSGAKATAGKAGNPHKKGSNPPTVRGAKTSATTRGCK